MTKVQNYLFKLGIEQLTLFYLSAISRESLMNFHDSLEPNSSYFGKTSLSECYVFIEVTKPKTGYRIQGVVSVPF